MGQRQHAVAALYAIARPELGPGGALVAAALALANHELFAFGRLGLPEALHVSRTVFIPGFALFLAAVLFGLARFTVR